MNRFSRLTALGLALAFSFGSLAFAATAAPASARPDCSSNANLWHVHRRLNGAIAQLGKDTHDYAGHRVAAMTDLQNARTELVAAEQYAVATDHDNPACFQAHGPTGAGAPGERGQAGSNVDIKMVTRWVSRLTSQLQSDQRDYGGHRATAVSDLQAAVKELQAAEASAP